MARTIHKLSDASAKAAKKPGRHSDGGGLYLNVSANGSKSWLYMWVVKGSTKRTEMGLGPYPTVSLARARAKAAECRALIEEGRDPKAERDREAEPTFAECADRLIESIRREWRNAKHEYQWRQTLGESYCAKLRPKRISQIDTNDVLAVLSPVWAVKAETASRLRARLERVFEYAKVKGWRTGENPAAWRGNLRNLREKALVSFDEVNALRIEREAAKAAEKQAKAAGRAQNVASLIGSSASRLANTGYMRRGQ